MGEGTALGRTARVGVDLGEGSVQSGHVLGPPVTLHLARREQPAVAPAATLKVSLRRLWFSASDADVEALTSYKSA